MTSPIVSSIKKSLKKGTDYYYGLTPVKKALTIIFGVLFVIIDLAIFLNYMTIVHKMTELSVEWADWGVKGMILMFMLIFGVSFPPLIGFSTLSILTGMSYGLSGWPLITIASVAGSTCSFVSCKYWFREYSLKLIDHSENLKLFVSVLNDKQESYSHNLVILTLIRLCPLPYSLTNGALSSVPDLPVGMFILASLISSPKLLVSLFVGSQMKLFGEETTNMGRFMRFLSIAVTGGAVTTATYILYNRMKKKLSQKNYGGIDDDSDEAAESFLMNDENQEAEVVLEDYSRDDAEQRV